MNKWSVLLGDKKTALQIVLFTLLAALLNYGPLTALSLEIRALIAIVGFFAIILFPRLDKWEPKTFIQFLGIMALFGVLLLSPFFDQHQGIKAVSSLALIFFVIFWMSAKLFKGSTSVQQRTEALYTTGVMKGAAWFIIVFSILFFLFAQSIYLWHWTGDDWRATWLVLSVVTLGLFVLGLWLLRNEKKVRQEYTKQRAPKH